MKMKTFILGFLMLVTISCVPTDTKTFEDVGNEIQSVLRKLNGEVDKPLNKPQNLKNLGYDDKSVETLKQIDSFKRIAKKKRLGKKRMMLRTKRQKFLDCLKSDNFANSKEKKRVEEQLDVVNKKLKEISVKNFIRKSLKKTDIGKDSKITFKGGNHHMEKSLSDNSKLIIGDVVMSIPSTQADAGINSIEMKVQNDSANNEVSRDNRHNFWKKESSSKENNSSPYFRKALPEKRKLCNGQCEHVCINGVCLCRNGYRLMKDNITCLDINECSFHNGYCQHNCTNLMGSHECSCLPGYHLDIKHHRTCHDINECHANNGHGDCQDACHNTIGSYYCTCENLNGTRLSEDGKLCDSIDECAEEISGCSHTCINHYNGYVCDCPQGWKLGKDQKICEDIDECQEEEIKQKCIICKNIPGSYICPLKVDDLPKDQPTITCPSLQPPEVGYFNCNRTNSVKYKEYPRELLLNSIGAVCELVCPNGDLKMVFCNEQGTWKAFEDTTIEC